MSKISVKFFAVFFISLILSTVFLVLTSDEDNKADTDVMLSDGHLVEYQGEFNPIMADYAIKLFDRIYQENFKDSDVYFALIPNKSRYFLDEKKLYDDFYTYMKDGLSFATAIDVYDVLSGYDYYVTDPHLKQEKTIGLVETLLSQMGGQLTQTFQENELDFDFYGLYARQCGREMSPDRIVYLENDLINSLEVSGADAIYDFKKLEGDDPYEFYLSGNQSVVTIKNDKAESDKRLVIFRDSFACPIAPLMCESYSEVVLVDLRYIMSDLVVQYVDFENADVLFLYSELLLNNSMSMK